MVGDSIRKVESQLGDLSAIPRGKRLGVLVITLANPYWTEMRNRYGEWGTEMGIDVEVLADPTEGDLKSQLCAKISDRNSYASNSVSPVLKADLDSATMPSATA